jgi:hypothetical protein
MTAKEKAEELTHKFYETENDSLYYGVNWNIAKQCATLCVDEIMEIITKYDNHLLDFRYWQEVKQKIEKL